MSQKRQIIVLQVTTDERDEDPMNWDWAEACSSDQYEVEVSVIALGPPMEVEEPVEAPPLVADPDQIAKALKGVMPPGMEGLLGGILR